MTNDEIISNLLSFVRVEEDNLEVLLAETGWISVLNWDDNDNESKFSTYRLDSKDTVKLVTKLQEYFYHTFYLFGRVNLQPPTPIRPSPQPPFRDIPLTNRPKLIDTATLIRAESGTLLVEQDTVTFKLLPGEYIIVGANRVQILNQILQKDTPDSKGFLWTDAILPPSSISAHNQYIRFYFNVYPDQAPAIAHRLIAQLDLYKVPFQLKYLDPDILTGQCDRIVLYVPQNQYVVVAWIILRIYADIEPYLLNELPLFVLPLQPLHGVGFAEEPFADESFGESRCGWLAYAVVKWAEGLPPTSSAKPPADRIIADIIEQRELTNLTNFHLNPKSFYPYNFDIFKSTLPDKALIQSRSHWLQCAVYIANFLCREVIWISPGKCIWMGTRQDGRGNPVYLPQSDDWERGSLGPVLFLFTLQKYIDDPLYSYVVEHMISDLKKELQKTDPTIQNALLKVYNYKKRFTLLSLFYKIKMFIVDSRLTERKLKEQPAPILKVIREKPPSDDREKYKDLIQTVKKVERKPLQQPIEFYRILRDIHENARAYFTNEKGWNDFFPGMNGLALIGFSYLLAYDPMLPAIPVGSLNTEP